MSTSAGYHLKRAQHALRQRMDRALGEVGLTTAQYALLSALDEQPDASNADLARACFVTPQTMLVILRDLQAAGMVTRRPHSQDRRVLATELTEAGRERLATARLVVDGVEARMVAGLRPAERERLARMLDRVVANLVDTADGLGGPRRADP